MTTREQRLCGSSLSSSCYWSFLAHLTLNLKDMRTGGEIYADGRCIYRDGEFLQDFVVPLEGCYSLD